ncbi:hypothetical protein Asera_02800 [Actinocatenispora sera]|uniref:Uncharacterized protein n=1 Tax=Actinocatenispora sera TaxID=390989 RepID=A0A810KUM4_9ACTN|nr:hypothetical protein Asera_02800 [Actinocatenispora sera]
MATRTAVDLPDIAVRTGPDRPVLLRSPPGGQTRTSETITAQHAAAESRPLTDRPDRRAAVAAAIAHCVRVPTACLDPDGCSPCVAMVCAVRCQLVVVIRPAARPHM